MTTYALVYDGVVLSHFVTSLPPSAFADIAIFLVVAPVDVQDGMLCDGTNFTPAPPPAPPVPVDYNDLVNTPTLGTAAETAASAYATAAQGATANSASQPGHTHTGTYEPANANIQAHVAQAHAPSNAQANADITKAEIEAKLTGAISSHTHAGGSDPWTTVKLASDFVTGSATAVDVTGLSFTPVLNTRYEFEGILLLRTATATVNPRAGLAWPTGMTDGVAVIWEYQTSTGGGLFAGGNVNAALLIAVGGLPNTTQSWPATIKGTALAGATPSGAIRVQLASETAATNVTVKAGSFIKYRVIP